MCAKLRLIVEMAKKNNEKVVAKLLFYIGWLGVELVQKTWCTTRAGSPPHEVHHILAVCRHACASHANRG